jgi:hypothetical protein
MASVEILKLISYTVEAKITFTNSLAPSFIAFLNESCTLTNSCHSYQRIAAYWSTIYIVIKVL